MCCAVISPHTFPFASSSPTSAFDSPCCRLITPLSKCGTPWPPSRCISMFSFIPPQLGPLSPQQPHSPSSPGAGYPTPYQPNPSLASPAAKHPEASWATPKRGLQNSMARPSLPRGLLGGITVGVLSLLTTLLVPSNTTQSSSTHPPSCPLPQPGTSAARTLEPQLSC